MEDLKDYLVGYFGAVIGCVLHFTFGLFFGIYIAYDVIVNRGRNLIR